MASEERCARLKCRTVRDEEAGHLLFRRNASLLEEIKVCLRVSEWKPAVGADNEGAKATTFEAEPRQGVLFGRDEVEDILIANLQQRCQVSLAIIVPNWLNSDFACDNAGSSDARRPLSQRPRLITKRTFTRSCGKYEGTQKK